MRAIAGPAGIVVVAGLPLRDNVHVTTPIADAPFARRGAKLDLVATQGFRDILAIGGNLGAVMTNGNILESWISRNGRAYPGRKDGIVVNLALDIRHDVAQCDLFGI